jgi:acyl-CoA dehydrogenase
MDELFVDAVRQFFADRVTSQVVREIEAGASPDALWTQIEGLGFADALVAESRGGAGLILSDVFPILELCGEFAVPVPLGETIIARGLLSTGGIPVPPGSMVLAEAMLQDDGSLYCPLVTSGKVVDLVLVRSPQGWRLLSREKASVTQASFCLDCACTWSAQIIESSTVFQLPLDDAFELRSARAVTAAALISGALQSVFKKSLDYANDRHQFGRPIGKFQAIQHQLAVMSEHVFAARMAAQIGCHSNSVVPLDVLNVAVAKARASESALVVADLAHSIHGAIGFTREYDLQLFTRRLHTWRQAAGTESYWHSVIGNALLTETKTWTLDVLRRVTDPQHEDD